MNGKMHSRVYMLFRISDPSAIFNKCNVEKASLNNYLQLVVSRSMHSLKKRRKKKEKKKTTGVSL